MKNNKLNVAVLGTGNIGCDLLMKIHRNQHLQCIQFIGRNPESKGIQLAKSLNIPTFQNGIHDLDVNSCDVVFDATSAQSHLETIKKLHGKNIVCINLTPAKTGVRCVPCINPDIVGTEKIISLISCGGQASIPLSYALAQSGLSIKYLEVVSTIPSNCAGPATRQNIDEYLYATESALHHFSKSQSLKTILLLNPAQPEIDMNVTVYAIADDINLEKINNKVNAIVKEVQKYVPDYYLIVPPTKENSILRMTVQVRGQGDWLPHYAGCLDMITSSAIQVATILSTRKNMHHQHEKFLNTSLTTTISEF